MSTESSSVATQSSKAGFIWGVLIACVIGVIMILLIYWKKFFFGSIAGSWSYPYVDTGGPIPLWMPLAVLAGLALLAFMDVRLLSSHEKWVLSVTMVFVFLIQCLIHTAYPVSLGDIVQSDNANSFYGASMNYPAIDVLTKYSQLAPSFPGHARSNMPGKILIYELFKPFTSSPQTMGYLIILVSTLGALFIYRICKKLFCDQKTAFYALVLYALVPCKLFFFPLMNAVTPVFILLCLDLFLCYIESKNLLFLLILGPALYMLILFEPSPLITGLIFVGILVHAIAAKKITVKNSVWLVIIPALAFAVTYLIFYKFLSFDLLSAFRYVMADAMNFNATSRSYWIWAWENVREFSSVAGTPVIVMFIYMVIWSFIRWRKMGWNIIRWPMENFYVLCLLVTFATLDFMGINRGETTRLWIYMASFFQIPAACLIAKAPKSQVFFFVVTCIMATQSIISLNLVGFIVP